jgi:hypothetical protein
VLERADLPPDAFDVVGRTLRDRTARDPERGDDGQNEESTVRPHQKM